MKPYPPSMKEAARKLANDGMTTRQIADFIDVSQSTVYEWVKDVLKGSRRPPQPKGAKEAALEALRRGVPTKDVAKTLGVDPGTVRRWRCEARR